MYSLSVILCAFLLLSTVKADGWDDFTNNLATDLTPLLALFGEGVTKQYLSESLTLLDNFIFAMAPLGIITAVISAIRVCGESSLRAFIGRAQEGRGAAEAELCSSTSLDVCELWNNGGYIRAFGRPKILELVHDRVNDFYDTPRNGHTIQKPSAGLLSFKQYLQLKGEEADWEEIGAKKKSNQEQLESGPPNHFAPNPNLSLNIGIKKQPLRLFQAAAVLGFALQAGVVAFAFVAKYVLNLKKNGEPMRPWSLPLTVTGSILLCLGMFLCAYLVEQSTSERVFRLKKSARSQPLIYWLQPGGQVVGDQTFDAFSHRDCPAEYITSWKADQSTNKQFMRVKVWVAIFSTVAGFILQFVGLRGMHSSVSLLQLGAIMTMAFVRAALRTQRVDRNDLEMLNDTIKGHELDWMAIYIEKSHAPRGSGLLTDATSYEYWKVVAPVDVIGLSCKRDAKTVSMLWDKKVVLGGVYDSKDDFTTEIEWIARLQGEAGMDEDHSQTFIPDHEKGTTLDKNTIRKPNVAARILKYRARLARLTGSEISTPSARWQIETRRWAGMIQKAVEGVAKVLFSGDTILHPDWQGVSTVFWAINVDLQQVPSSTTKQTPLELPIYLTIRRAGGSVNGSWKADESELEAVLGLWLWSLHLESPPRFREDNFDADRGSSEVTMKRTFALASTNEEFEKAEMDFELWVQRETAHNKETLERTHLQQCPSILNPEQCPTRYFGLQAMELSETRRSLKVMSVTSSNSLAKMCAHDIFISFFTRMASIIQKIGGETVTRDPKTEGRLSISTSEGSSKFLLLNSQIDKIASEFVNSGLGSREEAYMCTIPSLRTSSKLPNVQAAHNSARKSATALRRKGNWEEAEKLLRWIRSSCDKADVTALEKTQIDLGEFYRLALRTRKERLVQLGFNGILWMLKQTSRSGLPAPADSIKDRYGWIAFQIAKEKGDEDMEERLLRAGVNGDVIKWVDRNTSLLEVTQRNDTAVSLLFLGRDGTDLTASDSYGRTALSWAAANGCMEIVQSLLELNMEPDAKDYSGRTPLSYAAETEVPEMVELLLECGAFPNSKDDRGRTPLSFAAEKGNRTVVQLFLTTERVTLDARDESGKTALIWASEKGHNFIIEMLLEKGADLDALSLLVAAESGHRQVVELLLDKGANVAANPGGESALHKATKNGHNGIVQVLLRGGADLEAKNIDGSTALILAAANGHGEVIRTLLNAGADTEMKDNTGMTPLLWASTNGYGELVQELLEAKSDIEAKSDNGRTALLWAAATGHQYVVRALLKVCANKDQQDQEGGPMHWAAGHGHEAVVNLLLENDAYIDSRDLNGSTPLSWAARNGEVAATKLLLEKGSNPNAISRSGQTPLHHAAKNGHNNVASLLLEHKAAVDCLDEEGATPLHRASEAGHVSTVMLLLNAGADKDRHAKAVDNLGDRSHGTPMHWAAVYGHGAALDVLIDAGANLEALSYYHRTALHLASRCGFRVVVQQLVKRGADTEARRDTNETPLHFAVEENHIDIVTDLIELGSDIEAQGDRGTPLHFAAMLGHLDAARRLLEKGANQNAIMHNGQTPLHRAASAGYDGIVRLMLKAGADRNIKDDAGRTPLDLARREKHRYVIELLQEN